MPRGKAAHAPTGAPTAAGPVLLVTMGDPAGVGPLVVVDALSRLPELVSSHRVVVLGDERALRRAAARLGRAPRFVSVAPPPWRAPPDVGPGVVAVARPDGAKGRLPAPGRPTATGGRAQLAYVDAAADVLLVGQAIAVVTGPVSKAVITHAGVPFSGHTEHLARRASVPTDGVTMLFAGPTLRVALVTTHLSMRDLPDGITADKVVATLERVSLGLKTMFGLARPRVAVLGLNPHAGEEGLLGTEEIEVIRPALRRARRLSACRGVEIIGPVTSETGLRGTVAGDFDCAVAHYHDQATVPCKLLDMGRSVNVTLGLPFVRASVDHGTAYDAAEAGRADSGSMVAALTLAAEAVAQRTGR